MCAIGRSSVLHARLDIGSPGSERIQGIKDALRFAPCSQELFGGRDGLGHGNAPRLPIHDGPGLYVGPQMLPNGDEVSPVSRQGL